MLYMFALYLILPSLMIYFAFRLLGAHKGSCTIYVLLTYASIFILALATGCGVLWKFFLSPQAEGNEYLKSLGSMIDLSIWVEYHYSLTDQIRERGPWVILIAPYIAAATIAVSWIGIIIKGINIPLAICLLVGLYIVRNIWLIGLAIWPWNPEKIRIVPSIPPKRG